VDFFPLKNNALKAADKFTQVFVAKAMVIWQYLAVNIYAMADK